MPQEDSAQLTMLRNNLTPFLKAVVKAVCFELEENYDGVEEYVDGVELIVDEILQNLPAENSTSSFCANLSQASDTLQFEFDNLKKMQLK